MISSWFGENEGYQSFFLPSFNNTGIQWINGNDSFYEDYDELYEVPTGLIVLLSILYGSISVLAVIGNSLVMWIIASSKRMQSVTNCFIGNLAFADIIIGIFSIPFQFQAALLQRWHLPYFMCAFCPFVQVVSVNVSVFTLTAIAVDRHRAVMKPLSARPSKCAARVIIAGIWVLGISLAVPIAVAFRVVLRIEQRIDQEYVKPFCQNVVLSESSMLTYRALLGFLQYVTPLTIMTCVYARMGLRLWGSRAPGNAEDARDANLMRNKKKVIKMLVIVVMLFGICWLPLQMYNVLQYTYPEINEYRYINIIWFCCDWLAMSNSCYNPFIYGIYNEKFKEEFQKRCPFKLRYWITRSNIDMLNMDSAQALKTPNRLNSSRPGTLTEYRAATAPQQETSSHDLSADFATENRDAFSEKKYINNYCIRNSQSVTVPRMLNRSTTFYVFPSGKHKSTGDITSKELLL